MSTTRLNKWGNSQGAIIPKRLCDHLGLQVGDEMEVTVDAAARTITLTCAPRAASSSRQTRK